MNHFYPEELVEEIRISNNIVDVVSEYVSLKKSGRNYFGLCPFHNEKSPSMSVSSDRQIFHCFGCGTGGNVFHFIMKIENLDFVEALKLLADRVRIQLPEDAQSPDEIERYKLKEEILKLNKEAAKFYHSILETPKGKAAKEYLTRRSINEKTIRRFGLGYSPDDWSSLAEFLNVQGYSEKAIMESGLVLAGKNGGRYDKFRGRVIFPIFDLRGNVIGFGGRVLDDSKPKYMNSPETIVYNKSKSLYALNFAKEAQSKQLLVVEGYMDVISLHQSGIINAVASLGTALTDPQARLMKKYAEEVIISYDADSAGQAATIRGMEVLQNAGCRVRILSIPDGKDPDEYIRRKGKLEFEKLLHNSASLVEYKIQLLRKQFNIEDTEGKISFLNKMVDILLKVENTIERDVYLKNISVDTGISQETIMSEMIKKSRVRNTFRPQKNIVKVDMDRGNETGRINSIIGKQASGSIKATQNAESLLILVLCTNPKIYGNIRNEISSKDFTSPVNGELYEFICSRIDNNNDVSPAEVLNVLQKKEHIHAFSGIAHMDFDEENLERLVWDLIRKMQINRIEKRKHEILHILKEKQGLSEGDVEKLKTELNQLLIEAIKKK